VTPGGGGPSKLIRLEPELIAGTEPINVEIVEDPLSTLVITTFVDLMFYLPETNALIMKNEGNNTWKEYSLDTRSFTGQSMGQNGVPSNQNAYFKARNGSVNGSIWFSTGNQLLQDFVLLILTMTRAK
jgi:hypothetical protein